MSWWHRELSHGHFPSIGIQKDSEKAQVSVQSMEMKRKPSLLAFKSVVDEQNEREDGVEGE